MKLESRRIILFGLAVLLTSVSSQALSAADTVIHYGAIYTMNPDQPWADAMAIDDGEIVYVGNNRGARRYIGRRTKVINLFDTDMVLPGLHDVHMHPLEAGSLNLNCIVDTNKTVDDWLQTIAGCAATGNGWALGWGFDISKLVNDGRDILSAIDSVSNIRPVAIMEMTSHATWVNSKALNMLGFTATTTNPPGGHIAKDSGGNPNGLLMDTAGDMAFHLALGTPTAAQKRNDYQGLLWSLRQIRKNGITSIANARLYWKRGYLDTWNRVKAKGKLTARTTLALWYYPEDLNDEAQIATLASMYDDSDPMMRVSQVKMYDDGITINTTAAMTEPYLKDLGLGLDSDIGLNYLEQNRMAYVISELEKTGFDMHIHTIGDRGVHEALNAIEYAIVANGDTVPDRRHRLTHIEHVKLEDVGRFSILGVIADAQTSGEWTLPENYSPEEIALVGQARMNRLIPLRDLYNANATITLSSDWDVSTLSPFVAMEHALTRGEQSLPDLNAALEAYTINAAYALRQDHLVGSIEVGKRADITIVDRNLFDIPVADISNAKAVITIVDGKVVYQ